MVWLEILCENKEGNHLDLEAKVSLYKKMGKSKSHGEKKERNPTYSQSQTPGAIVSASGSLYTQAQNFPNSKLLN